MFVFWVPAGYGDITPNTLGQKWYAIWCMILQGMLSCVPANAMQGDEGVGLPSMFLAAL
jgi:hypothetical protein